MRRVLFSTISLLAFAATTGMGLAADIPRPLPAKAPAMMVPFYNWTGPYLGINGGYGWGRSNWDGFASGNNSTSGGLIGVTAGYNWQVPGGPWVFGIEGDIDWSNMRGSFSNAFCAGCETRNSWLGTARGRIGYAMDRVMPYVTGGLAVGDIRANRPGFSGVSDTKAGWALGAGIEAAIAPNWTAKLEYLHVDLGSVGCSAAACGLPTNASFKADIVRAGLNFRF